MINLHKIFRSLTNDDNFLSTIIETAPSLPVKKKNKSTNLNVMKNIIGDSNILNVHEKQSYVSFPPFMKKILTPNYQRLGICNTIERDLNIVNISFLTSLNFLLRPELYGNDTDYQNKIFTTFEDFICNTIRRNVQIDKNRGTKNTHKVRTANQKLIKNMMEGNISTCIIQKIINIFEINLIVFDLVNNKNILYWTRGTTYPYFNLFKNIHYMTVINGNYEPVMSKENISIEQKRKMYIHILSNINDFDSEELELSVNSVVYLEDWNVHGETYFKIMETFFKSDPKYLDKLHVELVNLDKKKNKNRK